MRISDWSSDVCSSDLSEFCLLVNFRKYYKERKLRPSLVKGRRIHLVKGRGFCVCDGWQRAGHLLMKILGSRRILPRVRFVRSEERRVGQEGVIPCRTWWSPHH